MKKHKQLGSSNQDQLRCRFAIIVHMKFRDQFGDSLWRNLQYHLLFPEGNLIRDEVMNQLDSEFVYENS